MTLKQKNRSSNTVSYTRTLTATGVGDIVVSAAIGFQPSKTVTVKSKNMYKIKWKTNPVIDLKTPSIELEPYPGTWTYSAEGTKDEDTWEKWNQKTNTVVETGKEEDVDLQFEWQLWNQHGTSLVKNYFGKKPHFSFSKSEIGNIYYFRIVVRNLNNNIEVNEEGNRKEAYVFTLGNIVVKDYPYTWVTNGAPTVTINGPTTVEINREAQYTLTEAKDTDILYETGTAYVKRTETKNSSASFVSPVPDNGKITFTTPGTHKVKAKVSNGIGESIDTSKGETGNRTDSENTVEISVLVHKKTTWTPTPRTTYTKSPSHPSPSSVKLVVAITEDKDTKISYETGQAVTTVTNNPPDSTTWSVGWKLSGWKISTQTWTVLGTKTSGLTETFSYPSGYDQYKLAFTATQQSSTTGRADVISHGYTFN